MTWTSIAWIVIGMVAILVMARGCGSMMSGMRGRGRGGCGSPQRDQSGEKAHEKKTRDSERNKVA